MAIRATIQSAQKAYAAFPLARWCFIWNWIKIKIVSIIVGSLYNEGSVFQDYLEIYYFESVDGRWTIAILIPHFSLRLRWVNNTSAHASLELDIIRKSSIYKIRRSIFFQALIFITAWVRRWKVSGLQRVQLSTLGVCYCSMFCCTLLYVHSSIAIILMGKRELVALLSLSSWCLGGGVVEWLFLSMTWGCLQLMIVVFSDHTHLLFLYIS